MNIIKKFKSDKPETTEGKNYYTPVVDIYENEDGITLYFDIPGADKEKIDVKVKKNILELTADIADYEIKKADYVVKEFNYGSYHREFTLPDYIDNDKIEAQYANGVLRLTLPKREEVKPKQVKVEIK